MCIRDRNDAGMKEELRKRGNYKKTIEKAHSQVEIREYYQTKEIGWLSPVSYTHLDVYKRQV